MKWIAAVLTFAVATASANRVDWAARAKSVAWAYQDTSTLHWAVHVERYDVELVHRAGADGIEVKIAKAGKVVYQWKATDETPFAVRGDMLYYVEHHPIASGAAAVSIDLKTGTLRWRTQLKGLGPVDHSKYRNQVWLEIADDALVVQGRESYGNYVELVDFTTGKTLANDLRK